MDDPIAGGKGTVCGWDRIGGWWWTRERNRARGLGGIVVVRVTFAAAVKRIPSGRKQGQCHILRRGCRPYRRGKGSTENSGVRDARAHPFPTNRNRRAYRCRTVFSTLRPPTSSRTRAFAVTPVKFNYRIIIPGRTRALVTTHAYRPPVIRTRGAAHAARKRRTAHDFNEETYTRGPHVRRRNRLPNRTCPVVVKNGTDRTPVPFTP